MQEKRSAEKWIKLCNIEEIIAGVNAKGFISHETECDDYQKLLAKKEFSELVAYEIYEAYFYADRHEFDLLIIEEIVKAIVAFFTSPEVREAETTLLQYLIESVPALIIVQTCEYIKDNFKINLNRNSKYNEICQNTQKIKKYFKKNAYIDTQDIEEVFEESPSKIIPLLKLLGCKHYVYDDHDFWMAPVERKKK